jgi:transcriptional regulator with XRE-family HTH domain
MAGGVTGSTVPRRELGRRLRELRNRARLTVRAAAAALEWSDAKLWRIETGQTSLRALDAEAMCRIYGAEPELTEALMGLAKETKARGWWHSYGDVIPDWFDLYIGLEEAADTFHWYEAELVPGLLQTAEYARVLIETSKPDAGGDEVERKVHVRMARQSLLTRVTSPPTLDVILNESTLRRPVGGAVVMRRQIDRLIEASDLAALNLRIIPFSAGLHTGSWSGPFLIMHFGNYGEGRIGEPPTVYVEGLTGALYLDQPHEVEHHEHAFAQIWGAALNESESIKLMARISKELYE